jgi:hypothetical protein
MHKKKLRTVFDGAIAMSSYGCTDIKIKRERVGVFVGLLASAIAWADNRSNVDAVPA